MSEQSNPHVVVYAKPGCPYTRALKRKLTHDRTAFVEHDVESDPAALQRMLELNGGRRLVPTIVTGHQVTVGFHGT